MEENHVLWIHVSWLACASCKKAGPTHEEDGHLTAPRRGALRQCRAAVGLPYPKTLLDPKRDRERALTSGLVGSTALMGALSK